MPPKLLPKFAELCLQSRDKLEKVAIVIDARGGELFNDLFEGLDELKKQGGDYKILFLECSDQVLARRYKETRRQHPLADESGGSVLAAIQRERELLKPARSRTDYLIDTTHLSPAQLKQRITGLFSGGFHHRYGGAVHVLWIQIRLSGGSGFGNGCALPAQSVLCGRAEA